MSKTLVTILNHNLPQITDSLFLELQVNQNDHYDLEVIDNGSKIKYRSQYTTWQLEQNIFWGGALNAAFKKVLDHPEYDSLLFLNNDIQLNGVRFVELLREILFTQDFALVTPCIAGAAQPFKQMQCWGATTVRKVEWIDMMAPLFRRDIIERIGQFDEALNYGWGQPLVCWDVCQKHHLRTGVADRISILHEGKKTVNSGRVKIKRTGFDSYFRKSKLKDFEKLASNASRQYFAGWSNYKDLANYGYNYKFEA